MNSQIKKLIFFLLRIVIILSSIILNFVIFKFEDPGILIPFAVFLISILIYHTLNYIFLRQQNKNIQLLKPIPDIVITLFFLIPFMLLIDQKMKGDFDIIPQLIIIFLGYTLIIKFHFQSTLTFIQSIIFGINIGLNISIIWIFSLYFINNVKVPRHRSMLTMILEFVLTFAILLFISSKLFIMNQYKKKFIYFFSITQVLILTIIVLVSQ